MQNYKKLGIEHFYKKDFNTAKIYFSLAYEKKSNKRLLNFISLCDLGLRMPKEAFLLFEFYLAHYKMRSVDKDFEQILQVIELKYTQEDDEEFEDGHALNYQDFLRSEEELGFKKSFENVIYSGKLVISKRDDFLEFLEKLLENGYKDAMLSYMEDITPYFRNHHRFIKLQEKLIGMKK